MADKKPVVGEKTVWCERVHVVGSNGVTNIDIEVTFDVPPATYTPGMALIVTQEIKQAVQRIVEEARKSK